MDYLKKLAREAKKYSKDIDRASKKRSKELNDTTLRHTGRKNKW